MAAAVNSLVANRFVAHSFAVIDLRSAAVYLPFRAVVAVRNRRLNAVRWRPDSLSVKIVQYWPLADETTSCSDTSPN